ncbi:pyridine nucleotide-disulfide oxidoreductase [Lewinellaceae bacterium SD302]|nr:pyridine nucleotide-disulfide oxidoreductase [Lewinellaceae bacterium SD302]
MKNKYTSRRNFLKTASMAIPSFSLAGKPIHFKICNLMEKDKEFDVIIVGGSYAGMSAAMALGRSLRSVLIIDSGKPCNRQTPHAHNIITQDGRTPKAISEAAKKQTLAYPTVAFASDLVTGVSRNERGFSVNTQSTQGIQARKILFATGVRDIMPDIKGFAECWGISILHCPYCHGYEVARQHLGILANGEVAFELCKLIQHWADKLTLFTNGKVALDAEQIRMIEKLDIEIVEKDIAELEQEAGQLKKVVFMDKSEYKVDAIFSRVAFEQHCKLPEELGCRQNEQGYIEVDIVEQPRICEKVGSYIFGVTTLHPYASPQPQQC